VLAEPPPVPLVPELLPPVPPDETTPQDGETGVVPAGQVATVKLPGGVTQSDTETNWLEVQPLAPKNALTLQKQLPFVGSPQQMKLGPLEGAHWPAVAPGSPKLQEQAIPPLPAVKLQP
jgi:hypothetical protein